MRFPNLGVVILIQAVGAHKEVICVQGHTIKLYFSETHTRYYIGNCTSKMFFRNRFYIKPLSQVTKYFLSLIRSEFMLS